MPALTTQPPAAPGVNRRVARSLVWKELRTLAAPAAMLAGLFAAWAALVVFWSLRPEWSPAFRSPVLVLAIVLPLAVLGGLLAGVLVTAAEREDRTGLWLATLPADRRRVAVLKFVVGLAATALMSTAAATIAVAADTLLARSATPVEAAAEVALAAGSASIAFAFGTVGGTLCVRVATGWLASAALLPAAYLLTAIATARFRPDADESTLFGVASVLAPPLALTVVVPRFGSEPRAGRLELPTLRTETRRRPRPASAVARVRQSLLWRELRAAVPVGAVLLAITAAALVAFPPVGLLAAFISVGVCGAASALTDSRSAMDFLRTRSADGPSVWGVKTAVWGAVAVGTVSTTVALGFGGESNWTFEPDAGVSPAFVLSEITDEVEIDFFSRQAFVPADRRGVVLLAGATAAAGGFFATQLAAAWSASVLVSVFAAVLTGGAAVGLVLWLASHGTPAWPALLLIVSLAFLARAAFRDAADARTRWPRRVVVLTAVAAAFVLCIRGSRAMLVPATTPTPEEAAFAANLLPADWRGRVEDARSGGTLVSGGPVPAGVPRHVGFETYYDWWTPQGEGSEDVAAFTDFVSKLLATVPDGWTLGQPFPEVSAATPETPFRIARTLIADARLKWAAGHEADGWRAWRAGVAITAGMPWWQTDARFQTASRAALMMLRGELHAKARDPRTDPDELREAARIAQVVHDSTRFAAAVAAAQTADDRPAPAFVRWLLADDVLRPRAAALTLYHLAEREPDRATALRLLKIAGLADGDLARLLHAKDGRRDAAFGPVPAVAAETANRETHKAVAAARAALSARGYWDGRSDREPTAGDR